MTVKSHKFNSPKQDKINKQINVENKVLVVLYKKEELNQMTKNDQKEIKAPQGNLKKLKKKLNDLNVSQKRSKKCRLDHKRKLDVLDAMMKKRVTRKGT